MKTRIYAAPAVKGLKHNIENSCSDSRLEIKSHHNMSFNPFSAGTVFIRTTESDVCRRQILTYKDDPRTESIKIFLMAVDPKHKYSNESEIAN